MGAAPSRVFHRSFSNYAYLFYMIWRCACGFGVILLLSLINFSHFFNLLFFQIWLVLEYIPCGRNAYCYQSTILKLCILVLHCLKMCVWFWGYSAIILSFFFKFVPLFWLRFFRCDIRMWVACGCNASYSFIPNFSGVFIMVTRFACHFDIIFINFCYYNTQEISAKI